jgi:hypothetical protein
MGVPMALHSKFRLPTQSQKPNMLSTSMPNAVTASAFVERAAKCRATHAGSEEWASSSHLLAVPAFVIVSW